MKPKQAAAAALAVCAAVLWIAIDLPHEIECADPAGIEERLAPRSAPQAIDLETSRGDLDRWTVASGSARQPAAELPEPPLDLPPPGRLILAAVDRETGRPLDAFTVRLSSATRFAEEHLESGRGEVDLPLTPATYEGLVLSPGYEPLELSPVVLSSGATVRLAGVSLLPGSGSLRVEATGTDSFDGLSVEVRGDGRRPCALCADRAPLSESPCPTCGFAPDGSKLRIGRDGRVDFTGLAHGAYVLRVVDRNGRAIGDDRVVDLAPGESIPVRFDVSRSRTVEIELIDCDGASLASEWSRRLAAPEVEEEVEIVSFEEGVELIPIHLEIRRDAETVARASFHPPAPPGVNAFGITVGIGSGVVRRTPARRTADRERNPGDSLWPVPVVPRFEPNEPTCELDRNGIAVLAPLSTSQLSIHLTAKDLAADAIVPAGRGPTRVRAQLRSPGAPSTEGSKPPVTYLALERRRGG